MQYLGGISKMRKWCQFVSKVNDSTPQIYKSVFNHWCGRNWNWFVLWWPTAPSRTNKQKAVLYIIQHEMQKYKVKKNPEYQSSLASQCIWSRAKANRLFSKEHTCQSKHPCQQPKRWLYRQTSPDSQYQNHIDYVFLQPKVEKLCTVSKSKTWSWLWLRFRVLTTKFRPKLKKVGETTRLFRCDLN